MSTLYTVFGAIVVAFLGGLAGILSIKAINRKTNSEADRFVVDAAEKVVVLLERRMGSQSEEIREQSTELRSLRAGMVQKDRQIHLLKLHIQGLESEVRKLGGNPPTLPSIEGL